jgi:long-subunit acyl-CoA synthetase (AMP-forming)
MTSAPLGCRHSCCLQGCDYCGAKCVPLYDTFGPDAVKFIIEHSGVKVIFCASDKLETLCEVLPKVSDQVVQVVVYAATSGPPAEDAVQLVRCHAIIPLSATRPRSTS